MSAHEDPPRLSTPESGSDETLRLALGAASDDLPSEARLEAILAGLPLGGGDGPTGPGDAEPTGSGPAEGGGDLGPTAGPDIGSIAPVAGAAAGWAKLAGVIAVGASLVGATYVATRPPDRAPTSQVASATGSIPSAAPSIDAAPVSTPASSASAAPSVSATASAVTPAAPASASASAPPRSEIEILREAQAALGSNPARALALTDEHARSHPKGSLGQEREMVRIQALLALGRTDDAKRTADAFKARNPGSAYAQRLDALFP